MEHFGNYIEDLSTKLGQIQSEHEVERRCLIDVKNTLKNSHGFSKVVSQEERKKKERKKGGEREIEAKYPFEQQKKRLCLPPLKRSRFSLSMKSVLF